MYFRISKTVRKPAIESSRLQVGLYEITLFRKAIRSVRLSITPEGEIKLTVPARFGHQEAILFIESRRVWIEKHLQRINRQKALEPEDFSKVLFLGKSYTTNIVHHLIAPRVVFDESDILHIFIKPESTAVGVKKALDAFYAVELRKRIDELVKEWEPVMGVSVASIRYRHMKTRWGTCNVNTHQIILNTELAKKSFPCIEYILVHEMAHLLERGHGTAFKAIMDHYLPHWRQLRKELNGQKIV